MEKCIEKWQILSFELLDAFVIVLLCHKVFLSMGYFYFLKDNMLVGCLFMFFQQVPEKVVRHVSVAIFQWEKMHAFGLSLRMPVTEKHLLSVLFWDPGTKPTPFATSSYDPQNSKISLGNKST